jgi:hypothetical protein
MTKKNKIHYVGTTVYFRDDFANIYKVQFTGTHTNIFATVHKNATQLGKTSFGSGNPSKKMAMLAIQRMPICD